MEMVWSSGFMFLTVLPFLHCTEIWKRIQFINSWGNFQEEFSRVTGKTMDLGLRQRTRYFVAMILVLPVCANITYGLMDHRLRSWQYCITVLSGSHMALMSVFWYLMCSGLARAARSLGDDIEQGFSEHGFSHVHALVKFKFLWLRLSRLTKDLGSCTGLSYAKYFLFCFGVSVSTSYGFLVSIRRDYNPFTYALFISTFVVSGILYAQCVSAQMATDEVGANFRGRLQEMLENYPHVSAATHIEMDRFLAIINSNPPVINFCGFVEVNRGLITSLMSQTLTYLIVMMQMNISSYSEVLAMKTGTSVTSSVSSLTNT
ncbi:gustatory and odorant receptor 24-like [Cryptotermes secundus]|uniref:gustatory and odorant receptor 24-like n=1 Tax=Cryptotermes secundus TaxID=105785 RepID=UPI000CD7B042|nr:gustatory and odorant receptor 24-like [Cryptotermes secundus]